MRVTFETKQEKRTRASSGIFGLGKIVDDLFIVYVTLDFTEEEKHILRQNNFDSLTIFETVKSFHEMTSKEVADLGLPRFREGIRLAKPIRVGDFLTSPTQEYYFTAIDQAQDLEVRMLPALKSLKARVDALKDGGKPRTIEL